MNPKVINPYPAPGNKHKESLDYIIANLPANPTFHDLNEQLSASIFTPNPQNPQLGQLLPEYIQTILPNAYNGYVNGGINSKLQIPNSNHENANALVKYSEAQWDIIRRMLEGINSVPPEAIGDFLSGIEEEIVSGKLTYEEQVPLLLATAIGKSDFEYWQSQMATPGTWASYLNADNAINYMHLAGWVSAAMQGALLTYGLIKPPQVQL